MNAETESAFSIAVKLATSQALEVAVAGANLRFTPSHLRDRIMLASQTAIVHSFREHNARMLPRMPAELWVETWKNLDVCHRVVVTHTCAHWRAIALASTDLWRNVDIHLPFDIDSCSDHENQSCMPGSLSTVLERSGKSTIFVTIREENYEEDYLAEETIRLITLIGPHIARIASLSLLFCRNELLGQVVCASSVWPLLRTLFTCCVDELGERFCDHGSDLVSFGTTVLPRLENLDLSVDHALTRQTARCIPPTLLRINTAINSITQVLDMIHPAATIQQLKIKVYAVDNDSDEQRDHESARDRENARQRLLSVPYVSVWACYDDPVMRMLEVFDNTQRQRLEILCNRESSISLCVPVFKSLQGQVRGVLHTDANHRILGATVTDDRGVVRSCRYAPADPIGNEGLNSILIGMSVIWEVVRSRVVQLELPAGTWTTFSSQLGSASNTKRVILTCRMASDLALVSQGDPQVGVFTWLETLEIWVEDPTPPERVVLVQAVQTIARAANIGPDQWKEFGPPRRHDGYTRWVVELMPKKPQGEGTSH